jgi:RHS repeat-associated protein
MGGVMRNSDYQCRENDSPFFRSRELDDETGLYYFRARYFNPGLGRFISVDPLGFDSVRNQYTFAENNPATMSDPFGERAYSPTFSNGCSSTRKTELANYDIKASEWVKAARKYTNRDKSVYKKCRKSKTCSGEEIFKKWFGVRDKNWLNMRHWRIVRKFIRRENRRFQEKRREYKCKSQPRRNPDRRAECSPGLSYVKIFPKYWENYKWREYDFDNQVRTIVHEWAHSAGVVKAKEVRAEWPGLGDAANENAENLAKKDPVGARRNADNYARFAWDVYTP